MYLLGDSSKCVLHTTGEKPPI